MNIGVSDWRLAGQPTGVARYLEYLVKYWAPLLSPPDQITLYVRRPLGAAFPPLGHSMRARVVRPALTNALWENLLLPVAARRDDVLFGPSYTLPQTHRGPAVVAIHSVNEAVGYGQHAWRERFFTEKYKWSARRATRVIANSRATADQIHERYGVPMDRIDTIWLGADDVFRPLDDPALLRQTRIKYLHDDRPYLLFVGGLSERRNVPMLLEAFSVLKHRHQIPHSLLFIGPNRAGIPLGELSQKLGITGAVVQDDGRFAHHAELVPIYNAAELFVLPSSTEGFSLTLAEAMSCGTPVVTVNRASLGEVALGYAETIDTPDVDALAAALYRVISSPTRRAELSAKSLERAASFRWSETARRTLDVIRSAARLTPS